MCVETRRKVGELADGTPVYILRHYFDENLSDQCEQGNLASNELNPTQVRLIGNYEEEDEVVAAYCAGCGGESSCHQTPQTGNCHVPCQGGGGGTLAAQVDRLQSLIGLAEWQAVASIVRGFEVVELNVVRQAVQIRSSCNRSLVLANLSLSPRATSEIQSAIRTEAP